MSLSSEVEKPSSYEIHVVYNGISKPIHHVHEHEPVSAILRRALDVFGIRDRPHAYALFHMNGVEIPNHETAHKAGLGPKSTALLREKIVGGG